MKIRLVFIILLILAPAAQAETIRALFWNLESGESSTAFLAAQLVEKQNIDLWGFSEVQNAEVLVAFCRALEKANPGVEFMWHVSRDGGGDRLGIIYRTDRLQAVPYRGKATVEDLGEHFFELDSVKAGHDGLRPALGVQLRTKTRGEFIVLVNHFKCCWNGRSRRVGQAAALNAFAEQSPGVPIVAGGDFNIPINREGKNGPALAKLRERWQYIAPAETVGTHRGGSILDAVFIQGHEKLWFATASIRARAGDAVAIGSEFDDDREQTDHRPILLILSDQPTAQIEALRRRLAELEAEANRVREQLKQLEAKAKKN